MGRICGMHGTEAHRILVGKSEGKDHLKYISADEG